MTRENVKVYADITKVDDEHRMVFGYASTTSLDSQNERVTKDALEKALPDYMKFANVREMHQNSAVGTAVSATIDDKGLYLQAHVVDDVAWKKVKAGVYKGFSIGGKSLSKVDDEIRSLKLSEISLVDRPANPECVIDLFKSEDLQEQGSKNNMDVSIKVNAADAAEVKPGEPIPEIKDAPPADVGHEDEKGDGDIKDVPKEDIKDVPKTEIKDVKEVDVKLAQKTDDIAKADDELVEDEAEAEEEADDVVSKMQELHDLAVRMGAVCDHSEEDAEEEEYLSSEKSDQANDLKKFDELNDLVKSVKAENVKLSAKVKELSAIVMPAKGVAKVVAVSKEADQKGTVSKADEAPTNPVEAIKKLHSQGPSFQL